MKFGCGGCSNKEDFLSNQANKQGLIRLISERMRERGCLVIQAEEDADADIVKAAVSMASFKTTTLTGEDMDLLALLLHDTPNNNAKQIYFRSDKGKPTVVYDTNAIKHVPNDEICHILLFCMLGKKSALYKLIKEDSILKSYGWVLVFSAPNQDPVVIESTGCKVMIALYNGKPEDSLRDLRYTILCKKVSAAKSFVTPERLPPAASATKFHSLRCYFQVMMWIGITDGMEVTEWEWNCQDNSLILAMLNSNPVPEALLKMIHCNCSTGCSSLRCS